MKIGIVCYPTYGGSGILATELGHYLAFMGNEVHFISYGQPARLDRFQAQVFYHEVEIPHYPLFEFQLYTLALTGKIVDVVKYEKLDIIHAHYAIPHAVSAYLAKDILKPVHDLKIMTTLHGTDITLIGLEQSFHPIIKHALDQSDSITAVSNYLKEKTIQNFNTSKNIEKIPNFVDTNIYRPHNYPQLKRQIAPNGEKILIHVSNFRPVKRVLDVIKIFAEVQKVHPSILLMVGDGPDRAEAEKYCRELNICDYVRFLGKQLSFIELLSVSDIFLLPSQSESFGLSALEAMSCGVPVVASNIGGIPELIEHGETGFVAEFGDTSRMAKYVIELFDNPKKHQAFAENARLRAIEQFDSKIVIPKYVEAYEKMLKN